MKNDKQKKTLACFASGRYRVNQELGRVESCVSGQWVLLQGTVSGSGYRQVFLYGLRKSGIRIMVYEHVAVYLAAQGCYDEALEVDHIDREKLNNKASNLRLLTPAQNIAHRVNFSRKALNGRRPIRCEQISAIQRLHREGRSQSGIAREMGLNRLSVRYIIKQSEAGATLKFAEKPNLKTLGVHC